jgi:choline dehydrogenase-like flavoprotein
VGWPAVTGAIIEGAHVRGRQRVEDVADFVIVGTGPGGSAAARVLSAAGLDVVMVEEGPLVPVSERPRDVWSSFARSWRSMGFQVARGKGFTPILQGRCVGGGSPINGAIIHRMPEEIHALWTRDHGVDQRLSYDRLSAAFDAMDAELHVAPAPEAVWGGNNRLMAEGLAALGWSGAPIQRAVRDCEGSARCMQGCRGARKQSMDLNWIPGAVARGARVYADCRVERATSAQGRASGVVGRFRGEDGERGPVLEVRARRGVIFAASAIQTPLLLMASGVGGASGLVGRRFQGHPGSGILAVFDDPVDIAFGATQGYETKHFWHERMKFETVGLPPEILSSRLPGFGGALVSRIAQGRHVASWGTQVRAEAHGRVRRSIFGGPSIRFSMTPADIRVLKLGLERVAEIAFAAGAREILPGIHGMADAVGSMDAMRAIRALPDDPRLFHGICAHLFGTATIGADAKTGVVGADGQSFELPALYVMDASVFPTNMGVNPQHTIAAIAWVMAEGLAGG